MKTPNNAAQIVQRVKDTDYNEDDWTYDILENADDIPPEWRGYIRRGGEIVFASFYGKYAHDN